MVCIMCVRGQDHLPKHHLFDLQQESALFISCHRQEGQTLVVQQLEQAPFYSLMREFDGEENVCRLSYGCCK